MKYIKEEIIDLLATIPDPEIPVLSIVDLGMVRKILISNDSLIIDFTPTYTGCPATDMINHDILQTMTKAGYNCHINVVIDPAWNTDWINDVAKEKLRAYGIAPPEASSYDKYGLMLEPNQVHCPRCRSIKTEMISHFGSTACKSLYKCKECLEPFDYFKCHK